MTWTGLILGMGIISFMFIFISINIKEKLLEGLKSLFFLLSIVNTFLITLFLYLLTTHPTDLTNIKPLTEVLIYVYGIALIAIIWMYAAFLLERRLRRLEKEND